jgi:hypothetical protein
MSRPDLIERLARAQAEACAQSLLRKLRTARKSKARKSSSTASCC